LRILVATTNPGKVREIRRVLSATGIELLTLANIPAVPEPEESGRTFADNALLKGRYYASHSRLVTVAEDSGLAIDALGGRPGVESARYPGDTYADKFANLYRELAGHPRPWTARFVCSLVVVEPLSGSPGAAASRTDDCLFAAEATVEGEIAPAPRGPHGFGYDPIFFYPPYGKTLGEATDAEKLVVSHRGKAFRQLAAWLEVEGRTASQNMRAYFDPSRSDP
jgi:XTP/dITP diphosphohydrolase